MLTWYGGVISPLMLFVLVLIAKEQPCNMPSYSIKLSLFLSVPLNCDVNVTAHLCIAFEWVSSTTITLLLHLWFNINTFIEDAGDYMLSQFHPCMSIDVRSVGVFCASPQPISQNVAVSMLHFLWLILMLKFEALAPDSQDKKIRPLCWSSDYNIIQASDVLEVWHMLLAGSRFSAMYCSKTSQTTWSSVLQCCVMGWCCLLM